MTDLSMPQRAGGHKLPAGRRLRFVTAAALFDGHDASINIMRRILQASGVEVIHLGHNRSVAEVATAALQEDADGVAVSSYQGGHNEYFRYLVDLLRERGGSNRRARPDSSTRRCRPRLRAAPLSRFLRPSDCGRDGSLRRRSPAGCAA